MRFDRQVPDGGHYDVAVCGAGPGGLSAALSAARLGRRVLLIDHAGCVGGYLTSGLMGIALDMPGKGGIPLEITKRMERAGALRWVDEASYTYDIETMKAVLEEMLLEAGVDVLLYARASAVNMDGARIREVLADGMVSAGFSADWFVDGTGHGSLAALAGCAFETGHPQTGERQPASLEALVTGVGDNWVSDIHNPRVKRALRELLRSAGVEPSYQSPLLFEPVPDSPVWVMAINHEYGVDAGDIFSASRATVHARSEIVRAARALRALPGWERFTLCATSEQIGLRDSRRIQGLYRLTVQDAARGRHFADGVVPVSFCVDVHPLSAQETPGVHERAWRIQPFEVPMRSLIPQETENLLMTGRCISGDFYAHAAYRMTCTAEGTGEAAGIALAGLEPGRRVQEIDGAAVAREMHRRGYGLALTDE